MNQRFRRDETDGTRHEERLAEIFSELTDRIQLGEQVELAIECEKHPAFAADLKELWGTVLVTHAIGSSMNSGSLSSAGAPNPAIVAIDLPANFGHYVLQEELGRGGMGVVYLAEHRETGEQVALKMMLHGEHASEVSLKRFRAEARAIESLSHPNIVTITDVGQLDGQAFFCMPFIQGETLAERLARGPMPPKQSARLLSEVAQAIEHAHQQGVLHRDIKPSNVLIADENNKPYILDFGLARDTDAAESLTRTGSVIGTPAYMAPEQAAGKQGQTGPISDVYSLGAILYHMLTGRPPFQAASPVDTVLLLLEQDPLAPHVLNRNADRQLEMIAMRCLQKPQDLRYATAQELANDLAAYLTNRPISAQQGRFAHVIGSLLRETHHASVMENWGLLWMWHSLALLIACFATQIMFWMNVQERWYYWLLWVAGFGTWAIVFWRARRRMGPVTFVERQIAHLWMGSIICIALVFPFEAYLGVGVLRLAPVLALVAGLVFLAKASILSGSFYIHAFALFATAFFMAWLHDYSLAIFGTVSAACFFIAGRKYHRLSQRSAQKKFP